jgi:uncharacterized membrane protein
MDKKSLFLVSFVAAVPGVYLAILMIQAFLDHFGNMDGIFLKLLAGGTLVVSALMAVLPVGIFLFVSKAKEAPSKEKDEQAAESDEAVDVLEEQADPEEIAEVEEIGELGADSDMGISTGEMELTEEGSGDDIFAEGEGDEFDEFDTDLNQEKKS